MQTPGEVPAGSVLTDRTIGGKYRLVEQIGHGGMGSVWRAVHDTLGHGVAVKLVHPEGWQRPVWRDRFEREAKLAARLGEVSPHVVRVTDFGMIDSPATAYVVMELLRGEDLETRLERGPLPLVEAQEVLRQLCKALAVAHAEGVIHRDIKPANVFLCAREGGNVVKLLDFGIAKATTADVATLTGEGLAIGTPSFMSPEQFECGPFDHRADLWAAAAVAYAAVTGREPFQADTIRELALKVVFAKPIPPTTLHPELPAWVDGFFERALAKKADERFQTAEQLAAAFEESAPAPAKGRSVLALAAVVVAVLVAGAIVWGLANRAKPAAVVVEPVIPAAPIASTTATTSTPSQGTVAPVATSVEPTLQPPPRTTATVRKRAREEWNDPSRM